MSINPSTDLRPTSKVTYGGLFSIASIFVLDIAQGAGVSLSPSTAALITAFAYFIAAYMVPERYQTYMKFFGKVAEIVASQDPRLSTRAVSKKLMNPEATASLILSVDGIGDLIRTTSASPETRS